MAQYTYSFLYSEFQRIAIQLRQNLSSIVESSEADEATKKLVVTDGIASLKNLEENT